MSEKSDASFWGQTHRLFYGIESQTRKGQRSLVIKPWFLQTSYWSSCLSHYYTTRFGLFCVALISVYASTSAGTLGPFLHYIKSTPGQRLLLRPDSDLQLRAYCDFDWASCPITWRSLTGFFVSLWHSPISWKSKKQHIVSQSSA